MSVKVVIGIAFYIMFVGYIAQEVGMSAELLTMPSMESASWWEQLLTPVTWVVNAGYVFLQMAAFQVDGMPAEVHMLVFIPMALGAGWLTLNLVRGTST